MRTAEDKKYKEKYRMFLFKPSIFTCKDERREMFEK
jgi:hypothetical protein